MEFSYRSLCKKDAFVRRNSIAVDAKSMVYVRAVYVYVNTRKTKISEIGILVSYIHTYKQHPNIDYMTTYFSTYSRHKNWNFFASLKFKYSYWIKVKWRTVGI